MPRRVLIFSLAYYPKHVGGAEVAIKEITDRVGPDSVEFHMVCLRFDRTLPKTERLGNVTVHRIGFVRDKPTMADLLRWPLHLNKYAYLLVAPFVALRLHRLYRFDAAWAMMAHSCGVPVALFNMMTGVPFVLTLQEGDPPAYIERLARPVWPFFVRAFTHASVIQVISTFLGRWAARMGATGAVEVIPNGVDIAHFSHAYSDEELQIERNHLGIMEGEVSLVTTSRLVHKNGIDDVIRALPLLPRNITFTIFGTGPDEDMLRAFAGELNVMNRVRFMGHVSHADLPRALKACDIFIRPSRSEGMGNSFIEAMAAGIPVIATQEGGIADFLFDRTRNPEQKTTGWAVGPDAPWEIVQAVRDILAAPRTVTEVTSTARHMVCARYDWNLIVENMRERVFSKVITL